MATAYPAAQDDDTTLPDPTAVSKTNSPSHSSLHANANGAIKALEAKLGTGSSTPVANRLLYGNGTGTSTWAQLTSAQLAASLSDETGSGSAVFATSPTLVTPLVNTINEATSANGVTIDGLNIKDGALNTNNSVVTSNIINGAVTPNKISLSPSANTVATSEATTSTTYADITTVGPSVTITVGTNGFALVGISALLFGNAATYDVYMSFAGSGANTVAATDARSIAMRGTTGIGGGAVFLLTGLTAGSTTFTAKYRISAAGTGNYLNRNIFAVPL